MLVRTRLKWAVALAALAIAATPAIAQTGGPPPDATVNTTRQVNLSMEEQVVQSEAALQHITVVRAQIQRQLETARAQRDVVKTLCLNDKLNQIDVAKRSADERVQLLKSAAGRKDADATTHEYTIVSVYKQRADQLLGEAYSCVGERETFMNSGRVTVTVEPGLASPPSDETDFKDPKLVTDVPKCTSCVR